VRLRISVFLSFFLIGCGGSSSNDENTSDEALLTINATNFPSNVKSYKPVNISVTSNYDCSFILESEDIYWISTNDNKNFSYRAPITLLNEEEFDIQLKLPSTRFRRNIGIWAGVDVNPEGKIISKDNFDKNIGSWLPSDNDKEFINSLMVQVIEVNKTAGWIAPPNRGINNMDIGYDYVNLK